MNAVVFSFTKAGTALGGRAAAFLQQNGWQVRRVTLAKFAVPPAVSFDPSLREETARAFQSARLLLFVGAAAIAVRSIAPFIRKKDEDPAVIVIDEKGQFVIPILSGHIGRANEWGRQLAAAIKGQAVITTATDVNALFAVDEWAARFGLHLSSLTEAKAFASGLLERGRAGLYSDFPVEGPLPPGLVVTTDCETGLIVTTKAAVSVFPSAVTAPSAAAVEPYPRLLKRPSHQPLKRPISRKRPWRTSAASTSKGTKKGCWLLRRKRGGPSASFPQPSSMRCRARLPLRTLSDRPSGRITSVSDRPSRQVAEASSSFPKRPVRVLPWPLPVIRIYSDF